MWRVLSVRVLLDLHFRIVSLSWVYDSSETIQNVEEDVGGKELQGGFGFMCRFF